MGQQPYRLRIQWPASSVQSLRCSALTIEVIPIRAPDPNIECPIAPRVRAWSGGWRLRGGEAGTGGGGCITTGPDPVRIATSAARRGDLAVEVVGTALHTPAQGGRRVPGTAGSLGKSTVRGHGY